MDLKKIGIDNISSGACIGGEKWMDCSNNDIITSFNPTTGNKISDIKLGNADNYDEIIKQSITAFHNWKIVPAPKRGELIYQIALKLRDKKDQVAFLENNLYMLTEFTLTNDLHGLTYQTYGQFRYLFSLI